MFCSYYQIYNNKCKYAGYASHLAALYMDTKVTLT